METFCMYRFSECIQNRKPDSYLILNTNIVDSCKCVYEKYVYNLYINLDLQKKIILTGAMRLYALNLIEMISYLLKKVG